MAENFSGGASMGRTIRNRFRADKRHKIMQGKGLLAPVNDENEGDEQFANSPILTTVASAMKKRINEKFNTP